MKNEKPEVYVRIINDLAMQLDYVLKDNEELQKQLTAYKKAEQKISEPDEIDLTKYIGKTIIIQYKNGDWDCMEILNRDEYGDITVATNDSFGNTIGYVKYRTNGEPISVNITYVYMFSIVKILEVIGESKPEAIDLTRYSNGTVLKVQLRRGVIVDLSIRKLLPMKLFGCILAVSEYPINDKYWSLCYTAHGTCIGEVTKNEFMYKPLEFDYDIIKIIKVIPKKPNEIDLSKYIGRVIKVQLRNRKVYDFTIKELPYFHVCNDVLIPRFLAVAMNIGHMSREYGINGRLFRNTIDSEFDIIKIY